MRFKSVYRIGVLICFCLLTVIIAAAQPGNPAGEVDPTVPISGIEVLIALGGLLGVKKFLTRKKSN